MLETTQYNYKLYKGDVVQISKTPLSAVKDKRVLGEHDRTVVTNYMHYIPGATLNFFSPSLDFVSEGRYFHVRSLGYSKYLQLAFRFVDDMQKLVNDIISRKKDGVINHGATTIPSHYLTFS